MDPSEIVDHILFVDEKNPMEWVVFNFRTWILMINAIMVKYAGKSEEESDSIIFASPIVTHALDDYMSVLCRAHDVTYHWAMLLAHGEQYWLRGIDSREPEGFYEWDAQYRKDHNLKAESFEFNDDALPDRK